MASSRERVRLSAVGRLPRESSADIPPSSRHWRNGRRLPATAGKEWAPAPNPRKGRRCPIARIMARAETGPGKIGDFILFIPVRRRSSAAFSYMQADSSSSGREQLPLFLQKGKGRSILNGQTVDGQVFRLQCAGTLKLALPHGPGSVPAGNESGRYRYCRTRRPGQQ